MPSPKRLIAVDLDGTLLREGGTNPDDRAALHRAQSLGVPVILATGRSHFSAMPVAEELGFATPLVSYNGAWTTGSQGELLRDKRVPLPLAREVLAKCREIRLAVRVFLPDSIIMSEEPGPDELFFKFRPFERIDLEIADTLTEPPVQMVLVHRNDVNAFTTLFSGAPVQTELRWMVQGHDPETPHLWALHVLHPQGKKSSALAVLCEEWGIRPENVLAFGDGMNDIDMLEWAGTGVSFPWAAPDAQTAANLITQHGDPHPIATVVERWLE